MRAGLVVVILVIVGLAIAKSQGGGDGGSSPSATVAPVTSATSSGSVVVTPSPDSTEVQAAITATHSCASDAPSCAWYFEASDYPAGTTCPAAIDMTHLAGSGGVQQAAGTMHQTIAFDPAPPGGSEVCVYVDDSLGNQQLVG